MKKILFIAASPALLCGCRLSSQSDEARFQALETSVSNLQWRADRNRDVCNSNFLSYDKSFSDQDAVNSNMLALAETNSAEIEWLQLQVNFR